MDLSVLTRRRPKRRFKPSAAVRMALNPPRGEFVGDMPRPRVGGPVITFTALPGLRAQVESEDDDPARARFVDAVVARRLR